MKLRTISLGTDPEVQNFDVAIIERANVADVLIVPVDVAGMRILSSLPITEGYCAGTAFTTDVEFAYPSENTPPDAIDDSDTTDEDTDVTIGVLANDTEVDGDTLTVSSATDGANDTVVLIDDRRNMQVLVGVHAANDAARCVLLHVHSGASWSTVH